MTPFINSSVRAGPTSLNRGHQGWPLLAVLHRLQEAAGHRPGLGLDFLVVSWLWKMQTPLLPAKKTMESAFHLDANEIPCSPYWTGQQPTNRTEHLWHKAEDEDVLAHFPFSSTASSLVTAKGCSQEISCADTWSRPISAMRCVMRLVGMHCAAVPFHRVQAWPGERWKGGSREIMEDF